MVTPEWKVISGSVTMEEAFQKKKKQSEEGLGRQQGDQLIPVYLGPPEFWHWKSCVPDDPEWLVKLLGREGDCLS